MRFEVNQTIAGIILSVLGAILCFFGVKSTITDTSIDSLGVRIGLILMVLLFTLGLVIIGIWFIIEDKNRKENKRKREQSSTTIYADFDSVSIKGTSGSFDEKGPDRIYYTIVCSWVNPDDNKLYYFESDSLYHNPKELIKEKNINKFKIIYEIGNIKNYEVDLSDVEECK